MASRRLRRRRRPDDDLRLLVDARAGEMGQSPRIQRRPAEQAAKVPPLLLQQAPQPRRRARVPLRRLPAAQPGQSKQRRTSAISKATLPPDIGCTHSSATIRAASNAGWSSRIFTQPSPSQASTSISPRLRFNGSIFPSAAPLTFTDRLHPPPPPAASARPRPERVPRRRRIRH